MYNQLTRLNVSDMSNHKTQMRIISKVHESLSDFIKGTGVQISEVVIADIRVIKTGENQTIGIFQQLLSSDAGKQLMGTLGEHAMDILGQLPQQAVELNSERPSLSSASTVPIGELRGETNEQLDVLIGQVSRLRILTYQITLIYNSRSAAVATQILLPALANSTGSVANLTAAFTPLI
jgi:hypothetical protein